MDWIKSWRGWVVVLAVLMPTVLMGRPLTVVATTSIIGDWVAVVGGEKVLLTVLVGPDGDVHHVQPTPRQTVALSQADLLFENGLGLEEPWLDKFYRASGSKAERVVLAQGFTLIAGSCCPHEPGHEHEHAHDTLWDPHVWMDPLQAKRMVDAIARHLQAADPDNADFYATRAARYGQELETLDEQIRNALATIPPERRQIITFHNTFNYFARRYQVIIPATLLESFSTDANEPSARRFAGLVKLIRENRIPAIFAENTTNPALAKQLAREANLPEPVMLYTDALGEPGTPGETYLGMMRWNAEAIARALQP
jgi:zinc/manganese transport system substrate-binding protein